MFSGTGTAIITPMKNGIIDVESLKKIVNFQLENGIDAIFPCGTTGEIATLTDEEYALVIKTVVDIVEKKVPVIAGVGGNDTRKVIKNIKTCESLGVDAVLAVCPYYNKPTQDGLIAHFSAIAESTKLPIMLYNVPGRTVTNISNATIVSLAKKYHNISSLKDATGSLERVAELNYDLNKAGVKKFKQFCGDDATVLGFTAMGGAGLISVASNIYPNKIAKMTKLALDGNFKDAKILQDKCINFCNIMFVETNPSPVKFAASTIGLCENEVRLPLAKLSKSGELSVDSAMSEI